MARLGRRSWWTVVVTAAGGLLLSLVVVIDGGGAEPVEEARGSAPASRPAPQPTPAPAAGSARESRSVGRSSAELRAASPRQRAPRRVQIAAAGIDLAVAPVGVEADRQMRLPDDPRVLGWYRFGAAPGSGTGSAVVAGHVDSERFGVGPLADLGAVGPADVVSVRLSSGRWRRYRVDSVERFDRQALPDAVFARTGPERLRIVTCTGAYLSDEGGYQENLVVTAVPA